MGCVRAGMGRGGAGWGKHLPPTCALTMLTLLLLGRCRSENPRRRASTPTMRRLRGGSQCSCGLSSAEEEDGEQQYMDVGENPAEEEDGGDMIE